MSSKHSSAAQLIRRGLYDDLQSFAQLEERISALGDENTKIVGDALRYLLRDISLPSKSCKLIQFGSLDSCRLKFGKS